LAFLANTGSGRIQFTYWEKDARTLAGVSTGSGWAVSAAHRFDQTWTIGAGWAKPSRETFGPKKTAHIQA